MKRTVIILFSTIFINSLFSQDSQINYSEEVGSLNNIIETLYAVISGDAGVKRDWDLFKHLFSEKAHLIPISENSEGRLTSMFLSPEDYVDRSGDFLVKNGFFEKELYRVTESYGALTHVFSTYEAFRSSTDDTPFMRGINSIQLFNDGNRWWITNIQWFRESEDHPLPAKYLPRH